MLDVKSLGFVIRQERKRQGLRQQELAAVSSVGVRFLVELENGKATAQIGKAIDVLAALGCDVAIRMPDGTMVSAVEK